MLQVFLSIGHINSNENCISFWTDEAVKTHSQKCALTIVQWPVLFTLFMIFLCRMPSSTLPLPRPQVLSQSLLPRPPSPRPPPHIPRNSNRWFSSLLPSQAWTISGPSSMFVHYIYNIHVYIIYVLGFYHFFNWVPKFWDCCRADKQNYLFNQL